MVHVSNPGIQYCHFDSSAHWFLGSYLTAAEGAFIEIDLRLITKRQSISIMYIRWEKQSYSELWEHLT